MGCVLLSAGCELLVPVGAPIFLIDIYNIIELRGLTNSGGFFTYKLYICEKKSEIMEQLSVYEDANRYLNNAKDILSKKAGKKDGEYEDVKYVKMAGGTAYSGVLLAVDEYLQRKEGLKYTKPKSIEEYRTRVAKQNQKLLKFLNEAYSELHLSMYYHGVPSTKIWANGQETAKQIIDFIK